jgi:protein O-GlcNAc transferase
MVVRQAERDLRNRTASSNADAAIQSAALLHQQGRSYQADALCTQVLQAIPHHYGALHLRGLIALEAGELERGIELIERSLRSNPRQAAAHSNIGNALLSAGQAEPALQRLEHAVRLSPDYVPALYNRANVLRELKRHEEALRGYDQTLRLRPDHALALNNRGLTLAQLTRTEEALASFRRALELEPQCREALRNAAALLLKAGRPEEAVPLYQRLLALTPGDVEALMNLGQALRDLGRRQEAEQALSELLRVAPGHPHAVGELLHLRMERCDWTDYGSLTSRLCADMARNPRVAAPWSLLLVDAPDLQLACARTFGSERYAGRSELGELMRRGERSGERIRVAYVSADFCEHPVSRLLVGVLERHAREGFELIGVSLREAAVESSDFERRVRSGFDQWIELGGATDRQLAQRLRELGVDIAVDLMGYTQGLRLGIFAHRAAPVQVNFLGYAGTLGVPYMDYILADEVVIPPGEERHYSEQVVRLPHSYLPHDDRRELAAKPSRSEAGLPDEGFVFCAFTNAYKINPPVFEVWMRLLRETPGSVLWLRGIAEEARKNLEREAQSRGVQAHRLVYAPHVAGMGEHLARQSLADLYLDTLPYNAHSTAVDALWAGVPVLTCAGRSFASRVAASALTAVGLEGLITQDLEQYERRGLELTRDPEQLRSLRSRLESARASAPLFDTARYTRDLEDAFRYMHQRALSAQAPLSIDLAPAALSGRVPVRIGAAPT